MTENEKETKEVTAAPVEGKGPGKAKAAVKKPKAEPKVKAKAAAKTKPEPGVEAKPAAEAKAVNAKAVNAKPKKAVPEEITVVQKRSGIGRPKDQKRTLVGLGFTKVNQSRTLKDTPEIRGMIRKVAHLVEIQ